MGHESLFRKVGCPRQPALRESLERWLQQRQAEPPPVEYFHVVFTVCERAAAIAGQKQSGKAHGLLFWIVAPPSLPFAPSRSSLVQGVF